MKIGKLYGIIFRMAKGGRRCFNGLWRYAGISDASGEKKMIFTNDGEMMSFDERTVKNLIFWPVK